ncbi:MAG: hypothetical protein NZ898_02370 [Myxococcota bacterium]|nr:hypothetical protein [Myxococcota bacterium]MDW8361115.1 hypothetical protein [Myxococcales bacterium]
MSLVARRPDGSCVWLVELAGKEVRLRAEDPLPPGRPLDLVFELPDGAAPLSIKVSTCRRLGEKEYEVRARLLDLSLAQGRRLARWLETQRG